MNLRLLVPVAAGVPTEQIRQEDLRIAADRAASEHDRRAGDITFVGRVAAAEYAGQPIPGEPYDGYDLACFSVATEVSALTRASR